MTWHIPPRPLWLRWALIVVCVVIFFWSGAENDSVALAVGLGVIFFGVSLAHWLTGAIAGRVVRDNQIWAAWAGFGALTGGGGIFTAVLLMAFKDARHAHPFPDAPADLLAALFTRAPIWTIAGGLIGAGIYGAWRAVSRRLD